MSSTDERCQVSTGWIAPDALLADRPTMLRAPLVLLTALRRAGDPIFYPAQPCDDSTLSQPDRPLLVSYRCPDAYGRGAYVVLLGYGGPRVRRRRKTKCGRLDQLPKCTPRSPYYRRWTQATLRACLANRCS